MTIYTLDADGVYRAVKSMDDVKNRINECVGDYVGWMTKMTNVDPHDYVAIATFYESGPILLVATDEWDESDKAVVCHIDGRLTSNDDEDRAFRFLADAVKWLDE